MGLLSFAASAGGGSLLGGLGGGLLSAAGGLLSADKAGKAAREAQQKQIEWERERATHAHQWEVADLKAAGLNPILSAGGQGASTGGISAPVPDTSGYSTGMQNAATQMMSGITTALDAKRVQNETDKTTAEIKALLKDALLKDKQSHLVEQQTISEMARQGQIKADTAHKLALTSYTSSQKAGQEIQNEFGRRTLDAQVQKTKLEIENLVYQQRILYNEGKIKEAHKIQDEVNAKHAELTYWTGLLNRTANTLMGLGVTAVSAGKAGQMMGGMKQIGFL